MKSNLSSKFLAFSTMAYYMLGFILIANIAILLSLLLHYDESYYYFILYSSITIGLYFILLHTVPRTKRFFLLIFYALEISCRTILITVQIGIDPYFEISFLSIFTLCYIFSREISKKVYYIIIPGILCLLTLIWSYFMRIMILPQFSAVSPASRYFAHCYIISIIILTACQLGFLSFFASHILNLIHHRNNHTQKELEHIANHDILTGLMNRYRASTILTQCEQRKENEHIEYAIAILDIDDFKKINDNYGHDCGDFVLKSYTAELRKKLPISIKIARWGGEEFIIIIPVASAEIPFELDKIREHLAMLTFMYEDQPIHVTATYGISSSRKHKNAYQVLKDADAHLLVGKDNGKNRLVVSQNF
ncbi:MAG: GGDEF domain-containing protein [Treponema sp.]|nr:GGDEF domain-containing protein [Treponema sp.]